jgi:hypothetical protein
MASWLGDVPMKHRLLRRHGSMYTGCEILGLAVRQIVNWFLLVLRKEVANCWTIIMFEIPSPVNAVGRDLAKPSVCVACR